jgi:hypothetical protein
MLFNQFLKGHKAFVEEQRKVQGSSGWYELIDRWAARRFAYGGSDDVVVAQTPLLP